MLLLLMKSMIFKLNATKYGLYVLGLIASSMLLCCKTKYYQPSKPFKLTATFLQDTVIVGSKAELLLTFHNITQVEQKFYPNALTILSRYDPLVMVYEEPFVLLGANSDSIGSLSVKAKDSVSLSYMVTCDTPFFLFNRNNNIEVTYRFNLNIGSAPKSKEEKEALRKHVLKDIDIFAKSNVTAIYIKK